MLLSRKAFILILLLSILCSCEKDTDVIKEQIVNVNNSLLININPYAILLDISWQQNNAEQNIQPNLDEISGIIPSINNDSCYWVNEDSGSSGKIHLYSQSGKKVATYNFPGLGINDMEDLAFSENNTIYIGDFGDNNYSRNNYKIIEINDRKMSIGEEYTTTDAKTINFRYDYDDEGNLNKYNCEAFIFEPLSQSIYLFTKEASRSYIYRLEAPFDYNNINEAKKIGEFRINGQRVTAADITFDGNCFILKTYEYIFYWERVNNETFEELIQKTPMLLPYKGEAQGEAVCFSLNKNNYFTISEKNNGITPSLRHYYKK